MKVIITKPRNIVHAGDCGHVRKAGASVTYMGKRGDVYAERAIDVTDPDYGSCGACEGRLEDRLVKA